MVNYEMTYGLMTTAMLIDAKAKKPSNGLT
jgi:hypothetical protein